MLASLVNYCPFTVLGKQGFKIPSIGFLSLEVGEELWKFMQSNGSSFADFLQRQGPRVRFYIPREAPKVLASSPRITRNTIITDQYKSNVGTYVRTKSEKMIADCLDKHGFRFRYEQSIVLDGRILHPDFYIPECDLIIEHLGLIDASEEYRRDWNSRETLYKKHNKRYIITTESDLKELDKNLLGKLSQFGCTPHQN
jgi:hypothetical protein